MPTTIYTTDTTKISVGFKGKSYPVINGAASVPDEAVEVFAHHGFTETPPEAPAAKTEQTDGAIDYTVLTRPQLIDIAKTEFGVELDAKISKADALAAVLAAAAGNTNEE